MKEAFHIGLDVGTTSVKACAFNLAGEMVAEYSEPYPLLHPEPGAAVQSPIQVMASSGRALKKVVADTPGPIAGIGLSCPMHSVLLYHQQAGWAEEIFTWADGRGEVIIDQIDADLRQQLHRETGTPVHPMSPLVKCRWLAECHPEKIAAATHLYGLKELLTGSWTTEAVLDEQLASATGMYDAVAGRWSETALRTAVGMSETEYAERGFPLKLPRVLPANTRLEWKPEIAKELGVSGIPVFLGGSDGCLANLGSGITGPGAVAVTIGTSAAVRSTHGQGRIDPQLGLFNYCIDEGRYAIGGASNNGGKVLEYWQQLFVGAYPDIGSFIEAGLAVDPGDCPRYIPFLYGERAPIWDAAASSSLTGLRGHHGPEHIARAILEGVTDNVVSILKHLEVATGPTRIILASGGFTRSPGWVALLEEKSGRKVEIAEVPQASAYGAALVAARALAHDC